MKSGNTHTILGDNETMSDDTYIRDTQEISGDTQTISGNTLMVQVVLRYKRLCDIQVISVDR